MPNASSGYGSSITGSNIYQKTQNLRTKSASKIAEVKRVIEEKSGTVLDYESMATLPEEIESIKTISTVTNELCVLKKTTEIGKSGLKMCGFNKQNGIFIGTFADSTDMLVINTNLHHEESRYMQILPLPANSDASTTYKGYIGTDVLSIFSIGCLPNISHTFRS